MSPIPMAQIIREQHVRDMLAAIEEWRRSSCIERDHWRSHARVAISEFRTRYQRPERAAFQAAVARARAKRAASYPFCDTAKCPYWRGYCTRDPACND